MEEVVELKKAEIIAKLQELGVEVNPGKNKADLLEILASEESKLNGGVTVGSSGPVASPVRVLADAPETPKSDIQRILDAVGGLAQTMDSLQKRVSRIEIGGKEDFKLDMKTEDVAIAARGKEGLDPRIVKIVEDTLGIDFGIEIKGNGDRPGFELTVLVPKRLSNVPDAFRPVRDAVSGEYKIDEKTKQVLEEKYWPGDRRSMQMGATASYDMIQERCNRIRAFIISWYQKSNRPSPEFKLKQ